MIKSDSDERFVSEGMVSNHPLKVKLLPGEGHDDDIDLDGASGKKASFVSGLITATSNFSVQYNFQSISIALIVMSTAECTSSVDNCKDGIQSTWVKGTATATVFAGAIAGQLIMGYAGDILGRNKAMLFTLSLASVSALLSALVSFGSPDAVYSLIILCRFVLGVGLGGVYPLSATKAAEDGASADGRTDVTGAAWSFFWQCPGAMTPWLIAYFFTYTSMSTDLKWRLLLGLGFLPGIIVAVASYYDSADDHQRSIEASRSEDAEASTAKPAVDIMVYLRDWEIRKKLIVTGGGWFLYDVCYYGVNLFGGEILDAISNSDDDNVSTNSSIRRTTSQQLIALSTSIPACILTILLFERVGIKGLHCWGFVFIALCFTLMAIFFDDLKENNPDGLFALYCILLFSLTCGPNVTTYVLPAHSYPKEVRATFNGISAALGKLGAVVGAYLYGVVADATSYVVIMVLCAFLAMTGAVISYLWFPEEHLAYQPVDTKEDDKRGKC